MLHKIKSPLPARALVTCLAAATILAGCDQSPENDEKGAIKSEKGVPDNHGDDPKLAAPDPASFKPRMFNVIYMKFGESKGDPKLTARHAFFRADGTNDDFGCAIEYLKKNDTTGDGCGILVDPDHGRIQTNFENLEYHEPARVYVFVDNTDVAFNPVTPLIFTSWGAFQDQYASPRPTPKDANKSFYGLKDDLTYDSRTVLYFENHWRNGSGNIITRKNEANYSLNFNLLACKEADRAGTCAFTEGNVIPIVVDPDTGNGSGRPPDNP